MKAWEMYAQQVKSGEIIACKRIRQAVNRYFLDLENPNFYFDDTIVERFIKFSQLCPHVKGPLRGKPIELSDWQIFLFANLLGFKYKDTGLRKYRSAYVQVARKNAKSTVAAVLANWFLLMETDNKIFTPPPLAETRPELFLMMPVKCAYYPNR
ncbi:Phage terminase-like protein, large subunit [Rodentibacter pneumotropicus]|uniref:Phage terminase-like protein, large subunit n=1 Tax=Rodentibacter pneumotropicus TaxID=758 RepID=A0A3S4TU90_9PAST|nr:Phage terminase-like protein, large subunit [Rodentibacter pneumotropicus]